MENLNVNPKQKATEHFIQMFRYLLVAIVAFIVDFGTLIILERFFNVNYLLAATISFSLGVIVNFLLSIRWIFLTPKASKRRHEFLSVLVVAIIGLIFNDLILWLFTSKVGLFYIYSKLIATGIVFFWNFYARKFLLYND